MKEELAVKNVARDDYSIHCASCYSINDLRMFAQRVNEKIVGWLFLCPQCNANRVSVSGLHRYWQDRAEQLEDWLKASAVHGTNCKPPTFCDCGLTGLIDNP